MKQEISSAVRKVGRLEGRCMVVIKRPPRMAVGCMVLRYKYCAECCIFKLTSSSTHIH